MRKCLIFIVGAVLGFFAFFLPQVPIFVRGIKRGIKRGGAMASLLALHQYRLFAQFQRSARQTTKMAITADLPKAKEKGRGSL